jgi:hypothetical protein
MYRFETLDGYLIDRLFQPTANRFQKITGKNCFFIAKAMFITNLITHLVEHLFIERQSLAWMALMFFGAACWYLIAWITEQKSLHTKTAMNQERISPISVFMRLFFTLLLVAGFATSLIQIAIGKLSITTVLSDIRMICLWAGLFFTACTPLPYQKSRIQQLVESFKTMFGGVRIYIPEPVKVGAR